MNSNFEDLLRLFNANNVEYLIVGGYAVMLYTEPRYTKDLDIWIAATSENAKKVYGALAAFGAPLAGLTAGDFGREGFFYQLGQPPLRIAWPLRVESHAGSERAWFIGRRELIRNKRAVGDISIYTTPTCSRAKIHSNCDRYFALLTASVSSGTI